jgi:hypothetical protein
LKADGLAAGKAFWLFMIWPKPKRLRNMLVNKNLVPRVQKSLSKSSLTELNWVVSFLRMVKLQNPSYSQRL